MPRPPEREQQWEPWRLAVREPASALARGGVVGLATVLLSRGQDVRMEAGSTVEMELQRPLTLEEARVTTTNRDLVPVSHGQRLEHPMNPPPGTR